MIFFSEALKLVLSHTFIRLYREPSICQNRLRMSLLTSLNSLNRSSLEFESKINFLDTISIKQTIFKQSSFY